MWASTWHRKGTAWQSRAEASRRFALTCGCREQSCIIKGRREWSVTASFHPSSCAPAVGVCPNKRKSNKTARTVLVLKPAFLSWAHRTKAPRSVSPHTSKWPLFRLQTGGSRLGFSFGVTTSEIGSRTGAATGAVFCFGWGGETHRGSGRTRSVCSWGHPSLLASSGNSDG